MPPDRRRRHTQDKDDCVARLRLLADDIRLGVVRELMRGPRHVGELAILLRAEQSLLSHHLRRLRDAHIVTAQRDGRSVLYRLAGGVLADRSDDAALDLGCCRLSFDSPAGVAGGRVAGMDDGENRI